MYLGITRSVCAATSWSTYSTAGVLDRSLGADTSGSWAKSASTSELAQQGEHCISCPVTNRPKLNWVAAHVGAAATLVGVAGLTGVEKSAPANTRAELRVNCTSGKRSLDSWFQSQGAVSVRGLSYSNPNGSHSPSELDYTSPGT